MGVCARRRLPVSLPLTRTGATSSTTSAPATCGTSPPGIPHSIQGLEEGCEFLLVFDDGDFSENETFLITDWFKHTPREVLAKNFGVPEAAFADLPIDIDHDRYIFAGEVPGPLSATRSSRPRASCPRPSRYHMLAQTPIKVAGGQVRITDSSNFPVADHDRGRPGRGRARARCARCTGTPTPTSGSTTSRARDA